MTHRTLTRLIVRLAGSLALVLVAAGVVLLVTHPAPAVSASPRQPQDSIPWGYASQQEGSGVVLSELVSQPHAPVERITVRNTTNDAVTGLKFVVAIERRRGAWPLPVILTASERLAVAIAPGASAVVSPNALSADALDEVAQNNPDARLQLFVGLSEVNYAGGRIWRITPSRLAFSGESALAGGGSSSASRDIPEPQISRALFARDASRSPVPYAACRDEQARTTSHGGVMPVRDEPGQFGKCLDGRWVEMAR